MTRNNPTGTGTFINFAAAKRILQGRGIGVAHVARLWSLNYKQICVRYRVQGSEKYVNTFVKRDCFFADAVAERQENSRNSHSVVPAGRSMFQSTVTYQGSSASYRVVADPVRRVVSCGCPDYAVQATEGNGFTALPCCKHLLAVARKQGFGSFGAYWSALKLATPGEGEVIAA